MHAQFLPRLRIRVHQSHRFIGAVRLAKNEFVELFERDAARFEPALRFLGSDQITLIAPGIAKRLHVSIGRRPRGGDGGVAFTAKKRGDDHIANIDGSGARGEDWNLPGHVREDP